METFGTSGGSWTPHSWLEKPLSWPLDDRGIEDGRRGWSRTTDVYHIGTGFTDPRLRPTRQNPTIKMAPVVGFKPTTLVLTAPCTIAVLHGNWKSTICGILSNLLDERGRCNESPVWVLTPHLRNTMHFSRALHSPVCIYFKSSSNCQRAKWILLIVFHKNNSSGLAFSFAGPLFAFATPIGI